MSGMTDSEAVQLLELLARYASNYGADCETADRMTVAELVGDLEHSIGDRGYAVHAEQLVSAIVNQMGGVRS